MLRLLFSCLLVIFMMNNSIAQIAPVEIFAGNRTYLFQQVLSSNITQSDFGFFHTGSLQYNYADDKPSEIMNQNYLTYNIFPFLKVAAGTFYANKPGFSPSLGIHYLNAGKHHLLVIVPRMDLKSNPNFDVMISLEGRTSMINNVKLFSRFQTMYNANREQHNRSYQQYRAGIEYKSFQTGLALTVDRYGERKLSSESYGIFVRRDILTKKK